MTSYIKPGCLSFYYDEAGNRGTKIVTQVIAYTADGYLLPCCWCDSVYSKSDITKLGMHDESLKVKNNESIDSILTSSIWQKFIKIISTDPINSPNCCHDRCGVKGG